MFHKFAAVEFVSLAICLVILGCDNKPQESTAGQAGLSPAEIRAIAKEAYIYGFPVVTNYGTMYNTDGPEIDSTTIYLKTTNDADTATFAYSTDNKTFTATGGNFKLTFGRWRGDRLGVFTWNDKADAGYVDVDSFMYTYERK